MHVARSLTMLAILVLVLPTAAAARSRTIAPPGDSSVSQYLETVPTSAGPSPTSSPGDQRGALTPGQRQALARSGADGQTLAAVVAATSPPPAGASGGTSGATGAASTHGAAAGGRLPPVVLARHSAGSPVASIAAAVGGGGGMGIFLPAVMLALLVGIVARAVVRSRGPRSS